MSTSCSIHEPDRFITFFYIFHLRTHILVELEIKLDKKKMNFSNESVPVIDNENTVIRQRTVITFPVRALGICVMWFLHTVNLQVYELVNY